MRYYPEVMAPVAIAEAKPQLPPFSLTKVDCPQYPPPPKRPLPLEPIAWLNVCDQGKWFITVSTIAGALLSLLYPRSNWILGAVIGFVGFVIYDYIDRLQSHLVEKRVFESRQKRHSQQVKQYEKDLVQFNAYNAQEQEYLKEVEGKRSSLLKTLSNTETAQNSNYSKRGPAEPIFESYLFRYFPGKIHLNLELQNPSYDDGFPYQPDFVYADSATNLHIDIELDEPYSLKYKKPIHFLGRSTEQTRDEFFLGCGWVVIRFCEEQVIRYPESCCRAIAETIAQIMGEQLSADWSKIPPLPPMPRWTEEQARNMARYNYRATYFPQAFR